MVAHDYSYLISASMIATNNCLQRIILISTWIHIPWWQQPVQRHGFRVNWLTLFSTDRFKIIKWTTHRHIYWVWYFLHVIENILLEFLLCHFIKSSLLFYFFLNSVALRIRCGQRVLSPCARSDRISCCSDTCPRNVGIDAMDEYRYRNNVRGL